MDDDNMPEMMDDDLEDLVFADEEPVLDDAGLLVADNTFDRFQAVASVDAVYGEPVEKDDVLIIPAAEVASMMGFGVGSGPNPSQGSGGGGGGWNFARPVALIVASREGVQVQPVVDVTKVAIAALTTFGFMASLVLRMMRPRRR